MAIPAEGLSDLQTFLGQWYQRHGQAGNLEELEQFAEEVSRASGQAVVEAGMPTLDASGGYQGSSTPCACGRKAKFMNRRPRWVVTQFGAMRVRRAYYYCRHCHTGYLPWDRKQGLSELAWSPGVKALVAQAAARLPYAEAVDLLEQFTGLRVEESGAERIVAEVGGRLRGEEAELMDSYDCAQILPLVSRPPKRLYLSLDGTSARIDGSWHEVKTGVAYEAVTGKDGFDEAVRQRYVAAQEPAERFGQRFYVLAAQAGVEGASEVVALGDGAEWIWNLTAHHYPQATQIVDYWHACEHIWALSRIHYGEQSENGKRWAQDHCRWLKERGAGTLRRALKRMRPRDEAGREAIARELGYFSGHQHRMQYARFRARGLMIGSGPVEAGCKSVVGTRLKRPGMRWSAAGADAVLAIRTALLSGQHDRVRAMSKAA